MRLLLPSLLCILPCLATHTSSTGNTFFDWVQRLGGSPSSRSSEAARSRLDDTPAGYQPAQSDSDVEPSIGSYDGSSSSSLAGSSSSGYSSGSDEPYIPSADIHCAGTVPRPGRAWPMGYGPDPYTNAAATSHMELAELAIKRISSGSSGEGRERESGRANGAARRQGFSETVLMRRKTSENWWLCSDYGLVRENLAMVCDRNGHYRMPIFNIHKTNDNLYTEILRNWCAAWCWCGDDEKDTRGDVIRLSSSRSLDRSRGGLVMEHTQNGVTSTTVLVPPEGSNGESSLDGTDGMGDWETLPTAELAIQNPQDPPTEGSCEASCSHFADCDRSECRCAARRVTPELELREGDWLFVGACTTASLMGVGNKKRAWKDEFLCPCNASYVSQRCCDSPAGLVWEEPGLKKGKLI